MERMYRTLSRKTMQIARLLSPACPLACMETTTGESRGWKGRLRNGMGCMSALAALCTLTLDIRPASGQLLPVPGKFGIANKNKMSSGANMTGTARGEWRSKKTARVWNTTGQLVQPSGTNTVTGTLEVRSADRTYRLTVQGSVSAPDASGRAQYTLTGIDTQQGIIAILIGLLIPAVSGADMTGQFTLRSASGAVLDSGTDRTRITR